MSRQNSSKDIVGAPPEEKEGTKEQGCCETMVNSTDAMCPQNLFCTINRTAVQAKLFVRGILHLQTSFDMLYWCYYIISEGMGNLRNGRSWTTCDKAHSRTGHDTGQTMTNGRQFGLIFCSVVVEIQGRLLRYGKD